MHDWGLGVGARFLKLMDTWGSMSQGMRAERSCKGRGKMLAESRMGYSSCHLHMFKLNSIVAQNLGNSRCKFALL